MGALYALTKERATENDTYMGALAISSRWDNYGKQQLSVEGISGQVRASSGDIITTYLLRWMEMYMDVYVDGTNKGCFVFEAGLLKEALSHCFS